MNKQGETSRLSQQSRAILMQGKTDMITHEVVQRRFYPDGSLEAARSAVRRLCGTSPEYMYIRPEPLDDRRVYFCLTTRGTRLLGISSTYAQALKRQGKVRRYAVSWFIHADQPGRRTLVSSRDLADEFALDGQHLPKHPFFIDETSRRPRLGFALVDHNAHPNRIVRKTIKPLARFLHHGWFDEYIHQGAFMVALLTFSQYRKKVFQQMLPTAIAEQLRYPLSRFKLDPGSNLPLDIHVQVIPGLTSIVTKQPPGEKKKS